MKKIFWLILVLFISNVIVSCKKDKKEFSDKIEVNPDSDGIDRTKTYTSNVKENNLKDDVWYYFKVISLWESSIPPLKPDDLIKVTEDGYLRKNFTQYFETADDVMDFLTGKTPLSLNWEGDKKEPIDHYSFLDRQGVVSDEIQNAIVVNSGMYVFYLQTEAAYHDNNNAYLYIRMVDAGSPAYLAGLRRGDRILSIDGKTNFDYNSQKAVDFNGINNALKSPSMNVKWITPANVVKESVIQSVSYNFNPILNTSIFEENNEKIGYLAFSSFVNIFNDGVRTSAYDNFETIFSDFQSQSIKSLIVDLRYNGGGSTLTAEYLINKLVPSSANGKLMYTYKVNNLLTRDWKWTARDSSFGPVYIEKSGNLALSKVYFLVTDNTASASELLINSLEPYMDVQLIGPEKTYGKPVGFFPIGVGEKYGKDDYEAEVYVTSFQMFNANGFGDYFRGLSVDKVAKEDYLKDFGDRTEGLIAQALYHRKYNQYAVADLNKSASTKLGSRSVKSMPVKLGTRSSDLGMFKFDKLRIK